MKTIEEKFLQAGMEIAASALTVKWVPDEDEMKKYFEFGKEFARKT